MDSLVGELAFMASSAGRAFVILMDPMRLMYLGAGCMMGLVLGIIPGIGGLAGTAMLLPFTFNMDPYTAFALLLGLGSTTATGDPIPAILFGVPGGAASAATVLDGFPMAKKGEAGRALSAAYMSSLMGGVFGAVVRAISIPSLRRGRVFIGSPEVRASSGSRLSLGADHALLLDRRRNRVDPRHQRLGGGLARLRPRLEDRERRKRHVRQG